eukprot:191918-Pleurochrysis_carterae.AAC.1
MQGHDAQSPTWYKYLDYFDYLPNRGAHDGWYMERCPSRQMRVHAQSCRLPFFIRVHVWVAETRRLVDRVVV